MDIGPTIERRRSNGRHFVATQDKETAYSRPRRVPIRPCPCAATRNPHIALRPIQSAALGLYLPHMNNNFLTNILKKAGLGIVLLLGGCIVLTAMIVLFFAFVSRSVFEPTTIVNDTDRQYRVSLFGNGDPLDGGYILSEGFKMEPTTQRTFRERIDCVMVEDLKNHEIVSLGMPEQAGDKTAIHGHNLSALIADKKRCWDLKSLEVGKLYRCSKSECLN